VAINHADLYRLKEPEEIFDAGLYELLFDEDYFFVEWPETLETLYSDQHVKVFFEASEDDIRYVRILQA